MFPSRVVSYVLAVATALAACASYAQQPTPPAQTPPPAATPVKAYECNVAAMPVNPDVSVKLDPATNWQPRNGEVRFTVEGKPATLANIVLTACFRWAGGDPKVPSLSARIRAVENKSDNLVTRIVYAATVPDLDRVTASWFDRIFSSEKELQARFDNTLIVPMAEMRVLIAGSTPAATVDVVREVGITSVWNARVLAVLAIIVALLVLNIWAIHRGVPGNSAPMRLIATRSGFASLSQFQIVLWSFLFGTGAIYVFVLSGSLIDIPTGALVLLGIAGATTVGSKIKSNADDRRTDATSPQPSTPGLTDIPPPPTEPPGPMTAPTAYGASDIGVALRWTAPVGGGAVTFYRIEYAVANTADWQLASATAGGTSYRVRGLLPDTAYDFQVLATNAMGAGPPSPIVTAKTLLAVTQPPRQPLWSDLVVTSIEPGEIDVTRMQMLFFTLISAGFVAIKLLDSYVIPDIPEGFMLLMSISNGVYLTSKFATKD